MIYNLAYLKEFVDINWQIQGLRVKCCHSKWVFRSPGAKINLGLVVWIKFAYIDLMYS
jgi:hypothetical protein